MAVETAAPSGGIFISYRREDASWAARRLSDQLVRRFGRDRVSTDVDTIEAGADFVEAITGAVARSGAVLVLIGSRWLTSSDRDGRRSLDNPDDFVRLEIETALARGASRIIPVLVNGAEMPRASELPPSLAGLERRQAIQLSADRFEHDADRLARVLESMFAEPHESATEVQSSATGPSAAPEQISRRVAALSVTEARLFRRLTLVDRDSVERELAAVLLGSDQAAAQQALEGLLRRDLLSSSADRKVSFLNEAVREVATASLAEAEDDEALQAVRDDIHRWERLNRVYEPQARLATDYWTVDDLLDYRPYARAIAGFIRYRETRPPLTIGIKAPWGAGKTSLMHMTKRELDPPIGTPERPRQIRLRERERLVPRHRGLIPRLRRKVPDETSSVTNRELLSRTTQAPAGHDGAGPGARRSGTVGGRRAAPRPGRAAAGGASRG